jgi:hypothetical protein
MVEVSYEAAVKVYALYGALRARLITTEIYLTRDVKKKSNYPNPFFFLNSYPQ